MFPFDYLPLLIKRQIISYAVDAAQRPKGWHVLLTTSHSFQHLAIPYIFLIIIFRKPNCAYCILSKSLCITKGLKIPLTPLPTVYLALYANATAHTRTLIIDIGQPKDFYSTIKRLEKELAFGKHPWNALRTIYFFNQSAPNAHRGRIPPIDNEGVTPERYIMLNTLAGMFLKHMPNVVNLYFNFHYSLLENYALGATLTEKYLRQLRLFKSKFSLPFRSTEFDCNLTHLCVRYNHTVPHVLAKLCPQILLGLEIIELPSSFSWSCFASNRDGNLCFSNLMRIELVFCSPHRSEQFNLSNNNDNTLKKQPFKVQFPKLRALIVKEQKFLAPHLFQNVTLSKSLHSIKFSNSLHALQQLRYEIIVDYLKIVYITVNYSVPRDMFYQTTNRYYGRSSPYVHSWMDIKMLGFAIKPELINWKSLDTLYIHKIHFLDLTTIIPQMPLLRYLDISIVSLLQEDTTVNDYDPLHFMNTTPFCWLSIKLKHLVILYIASTVSLATRVRCFKDFVRRLPVLNYFRASESSLGYLVHIP